MSRKEDRGTYVKMFVATEFCLTFSEVMGQIRCVLKDVISDEA